jgi:hypothetical protein
MARYLAVVPVQTEGRTIRRPEDDAPPPVPAGDRLVAVVNNGEWQSAVDVTFPAVYERLHRRYREGTWTAMDLYLLDEQRAAQIEDGRRVLMNGKPVPDPGRV